MVTARVRKTVRRAAGEREATRTIHRPPWAVDARALRSANLKRVAGDIPTILWLEAIGRFGMWPRGVVVWPPGTAAATRWT